MEFWPSVPPGRSVGSQIRFPWLFTHYLRTQIELDNISSWKNSYINSLTQEYGLLYKEGQSNS